MYRKSFIFQSYEHNDEFGNRFNRKLKTGIGIIMIIIRISIYKNLKMETQNVNIDL
jgi:hypothetical protein